MKANILVIKTSGKIKVFNFKYRLPSEEREYLKNNWPQESNLLYFWIYTDNKLSIKVSRIVIYIFIKSYYNRSFI